jgi:hypothetical protein
MRVTTRTAGVPIAGGTTVIVILEFMTRRRSIVARGVAVLNLSIGRISTISIWIEGINLEKFVCHFTLLTFKPLVSSFSADFLWDMFLLLGQYDQRALIRNDTA